MRNKIAIKKLRGLIVTPSTHDNKDLATAFLAEAMSLGYIMSKDLFDSLSTLSKGQLSVLYKKTISNLRYLKGADVNYKPMYPNFPRQVMEASSVELFINAVAHYWTFGLWKPDYEKLPRELAFETVKYQELGLVTEADYKSVFTTLLSSNESLSAEDTLIIEWFMKNETDLRYPSTVPFKENLCVVAGMFLTAKKDISGLMTTATDVLRVITYLNDGDVSLATNTKFKSMPRSQRRMFAKVLDRVASEEDINRHRNKWVKLFHSLHIGEYSERLYDIAKKIRNNERIETFNGRVESYIAQYDVGSAVLELKQRPSEFARRLDHLLRISKNDTVRQMVVNNFASVVDKVPTRVATQVLGHLNNRSTPMSERVVFPKGNTQRATIIPSFSAPLDKKDVSSLSGSIKTSLKARFASLSPLGKVWVDPDLISCPLPSQQRSASAGAFSVARGTRLPFGDETKNTLRFFIYWVGQDIDLSASLHDADFNMINQISYTNLRSSAYQACHSGDITYAPNGASEFIDITIDQAAKSGVRYVVMNVYVYSGPNLSDHEKCYAGWMTREHPGSNEIYDPKTVEQKVDLTSSSRNAIPVVFDLVERKAIWCDLTAKGFTRFGGNNIESNKASTEQTLRAIVSASSKLSLYELFELHAEARGELVESREEADTVFSTTEGVTPYDINTISSDYLV